MVTYQALFQPDEGGFVITFPDLPFGVTQGDGETDGMRMAVGCLETVIGELIKKGEPVPVAKTHRGKQYRSVALPALANAKAVLFQEFIASGIRKVELARRLDISKTNVDRLFDLKQSSRLDLLDATFAA